MTPIEIVCPSCGIPFLRYGARASSHFYVTEVENATCVICREQLDPSDWLPIQAGAGVSAGNRRVTRTTEEIARSV